MFIVKAFDELSAREIYEILKARAAVFVMEQKHVKMELFINGRKQILKRLLES